MSMELFNRVKRKARKQHRCELCGQTISTGENYAQESGKYDGEFFTRNLHFRCANFESEYCSEVDTEFSWENIAEHIIEKHCYHCTLHRDEHEDCAYSIFNCPELTQKYGE